jgi:hypothetical protein
MRRALLVVAATVLVTPTMAQTVMGKDYYPEARRACQLLTLILAGKEYPIGAKREAVFAKKAATAQVVPIEQGTALAVKAREEFKGEILECECIIIPNYKYPYPSVTHKDNSPASCK